MIQVRCPGCGLKLQAKDSLLGKKVKCPSCGDPVFIGRAARPAPPSHPGQPVMVPQVVPQAARPAPAHAGDNPFGFTDQPAGYEGNEDTGYAPRRRRGSPMRTWAHILAVLGALGGGLLIHFLKPDPQPVLDGLHRAFPDDKGQIPLALFGALLGLAAGGVLVAVVGRSVWSLLGVLLTAGAGALYWALAMPAELGLLLAGPVAVALLLLGGAVAGILVGALLGVLIGAVVSAGRG
jgi:hypothetical protein